MVPAASEQAGCVLQLHLYLVGNDHRQDEILTTEALSLGDGKARGNIVTRMTRLQSEITIIEVEEAHHGGIEKSCRFRCNFLPAKEDCGWPIR